MFQVGGHRHHLSARLSGLAFAGPTGQLLVLLLRGPGVVPGWSRGGPGVPKGKVQKGSPAEPHEMRHETRRVSDMGLHDLQMYRVIRCNLM